MGLFDIPALFGMMFVGGVAWARDASIDAKFKQREKSMAEKLKHIETFHSNYHGIMDIKHLLLTKEEFVEQTYKDIEDNLINIYGENYRKRFPLPQNNIYYYKLIKTGEREGCTRPCDVEWVIDAAARLLMSKDGKVPYPSIGIKAFPENKKMLIEVEKNLQRKGVDIKYVYCPRTNSYHIDGICLLDDHEEI